jgi:SAM-dependent methyltransferase
MSVFNDYANYYNLLYHDKDYKEEAEYIDTVIKSFTKNARSVLDIGCGTGKHDVALKKLGYSIKGIDLSETMISLAKLEEGDNLTFEVADACAYTSDNQYDVVLSLFHVVNYQCSNNSLIKFFKTAHAHLKSGGIFIFDSWYGPALLTDRPYNKKKEFENSELKISREAVPEMDYNSNVAHINFNIEIYNKKKDQKNTLREKHSMRYLFYPEIEMIAANVGFEIVKFSKWMDDEHVPGEGSWYVLFCLLKKS